MNLELPVKLLRRELNLAPGESVKSHKLLVFISLVHNCCMAEILST